MNIHVIFAFCNGVQYPDTDVLSSQILPFSSFREACIYNLRFKTFFQQAISKTRNTGTTEHRNTEHRNTGTASFRNTEHRNTKNS